MLSLPHLVVQTQNIRFGNVAAVIAFLSSVSIRFCKYLNFLEILLHVMHQLVIHDEIHMQLEWIFSLIDCTLFFLILLCLLKCF